MFTLNELLLFAAAALVLVLTPGPNMVYCVSRSLTQGPRAGLSSLAGVVLGFLVHLFAAALGLTALLLAVCLLGVFRAGYIPSGFIYTQF